MRMIGPLCAGFAAIALFAVADAAHAQNPPADENGRYTLSATDSGYLRLDTRTGAVSVCTPKGGWTCRVVPDERAALDREIGRLQGQVDALRTQLANRGDTVKGKIDAPLAKSDSLKNAPSGQTATGEPAAVSPPDRLAAALDHIWRHLVGLAARVQKKVSDII